MFAAVALAMLTGHSAHAVEYPLQFTPVGDFKDLVVAGYSIVAKTIVGNCSYTLVTSGSGKDPRPTYTPVAQTCTWDFYGDLLSTVSGAPTVPSPLTVQGTQTIYAKASTHLYTGADSSLAEGGFVYDYGSHYNWQTSNAYQVLYAQSYTFTATLLSNGDIPLKVTKVKASTALVATVDNPGTKVVINKSSCTGLIAVGSTCSVTLTYTDSGLTSPSGLAYDTLTIHLSTNTGDPSDFLQHFTLVVPVPSDN